MIATMSRGIARLLLAVTALAMPLTYAATPTPEMEKAVRAATFEVVLPKNEKDALSYERPLPLELIPYVIRSDHYWSIGTAFAIAANTYVSAGHVFRTIIGSQFGAPALRDTAGHVYPIDQVLKFSAHQDFIVFTVSGAPPAVPLHTNATPKMDDVVFAAGNALGEGVVIRDGLLTSQTPEDQDGRWQWLRFSAAASPGNSGGPLLDASSAVIGLVLAKSPNENLNYALPIADVLNAGAVASFDLRYSVKLMNARESQVGTIKTQFALPKEFTQFAQAYRELILSSDRRDLLELQKRLAERLFPKGNSSKLLSTVYDSTLPSFVQQQSDDSWDADAPEEVTNKDLDGNGRVSIGKSLDVSVFRVRRPNAASDAVFYQEPSHLMDLLLQGYNLPRQVGDQQIRITSLGHSARQDTYQDPFGRRWQVSAWPLGFTDSYVLCYALPVPEGYEGIVQVVPSMYFDMVNEQFKHLADNLYLSYSGTFSQWNAFLSRAELRPKFFDHVKLELDAAQGVHYRSARLTLDVPKDLLPLSADSELVLKMAYMLDGGALAWDVGGIEVYQDHDHKTYVGLRRYAKPDGLAKETLDTWRHLQARDPGYDGLPGHDDEFNNYWVHESVSARAPDGPGIDPSAKILYDVYSSTDAKGYPRDLEGTEHRLLEATHILER